MGRKRRDSLDEKHWIALRMIADGEKSLKAIAAEIGWSQQYLYDLVEGNVEKGGYVAELFQAELRKIDAENAKKIKSLLKKNKVLAQRIMNDVLARMRIKQELNPQETRLLTMIVNSLAKESPHVEIGSLSYNYTKGLSAEDLVHEFNRLKTIATGSSNRGAVQASFERRPGILPSPTESRSGDEEQLEDSELRADDETGEIS